MNKEYSFIPDWAMFIYIPIHIYYVFEIASAAYAPRGIGYAIFPVFIFAFISSIAFFLLLNIWLYNKFGKRSLAQVIKGEKPEIEEKTTRPYQYTGSLEERESFFKRVSRLFYHKK
jgi:hypothetical protein